MSSNWNIRKTDKNTRRMAKQGNVLHTHIQFFSFNQRKNQRFEEITFLFIAYYLWDILLCCETKQIFNMVDWKRLDLCICWCLYKNTYIQKYVPISHTYASSSNKHTYTRNVLICGILFWLDAWAICKKVSDGARRTRQTRHKFISQKLMGLFWANWFSYTAECALVHKYVYA